MRPSARPPRSRRSRACRLASEPAGGHRQRATQIDYDAAGRPTCTAVRMDAADFYALPPFACSPIPPPGPYGLDRVSFATYDAAGRRTAVTSGAGSPVPIVELTSYTLNGLPATLTDGRGNASTYAYDGFDRLSRITYPTPGGYQEWGYDPVGKATSYRHRSGQTFTSTYDALNRLRTTDVPAPGATTRTVAYDLLDRPLSVADSANPSWPIGWAWDALSRPVYEIGPFGNLNSGYDLAGRRVNLIWPDGFRADWDFNVYDQVTAASANQAQFIGSYYYDDLGRPTSFVRANGVTTSWGYDGVSRLTSLSHDAAGTAGDVTFAYGYNPAGQIVTRDNTNPSYEATRTTAYTAYTVDALNRVTAINGAGVGYDGNFNITSLPGRSFTYDSENRLTSAGGYGYQDDLAGRILAASGPQASWFTFDGQQMVAEYTPGTPITIRNRHVPGGGLNDITITFDSNTIANPRWPLRDERGSIIAVTDANGVPGWYTVYDEYGRTLGGGGGSRFGYTGQADLLPNLQDNHFRNLTPGLGRFNQPDPLGYAAGVNLYGYVGGDPVNRVDPLGLDAVPGGKCYVGEPGCGTDVVKFPTVDVFASSGGIYYYGLGNFFSGGPGRGPSGGGGLITPLIPPDRVRCPRGLYNVGV